VRRFDAFREATNQIFATHYGLFKQPSFGQLGVARVLQVLQEKMGSSMWSRKNSPVLESETQIA